MRQRELEGCFNGNKAHPNDGRFSSVVGTRCKRLNNAGETRKPRLDNTDTSKRDKLATDRNCIHQSVQRDGAAQGHADQAGATGAIIGGD